MKLLLTGGAGYIASHTIVELVTAGHEVTVGDNFSNSSPEVFKRLKQITGKMIPHKTIDFCDAPAVDALFGEYAFDAVIHFAGLKAVGESVEKPLEYYRNNLLSTINILASMQKHGVDTIIFSSTGSLYGLTDEVPINEDAPVQPHSPYSRTKAICEQILRDAAVANPRLRVTILRYFNPVGAHESGLIGEDPHGIPNNLVPYISQVAIGKRPYLQVFGNDYDTPDGTPIRDYIHVVDLAKGHLAALQHQPAAGEVALYNLGTGGGYSVLEVVGAYEQACGHKIPYKIMPRRPGDVVRNYADPTKANTLLGWRAGLTILDMCRDAYNWQSKNPDGYQTKNAPV